MPADLSNALTEFANANPDIVTFDAARGVVKFKSDVTFGSGSTDLNERAIGTLQRFAGILNSPEAAGYELMVAGHTDNQRVTRQKTIDEGNFDNWYLSAHRAISVAAELVKNGVSKARLGVAGYADQQPIASNSTEAGRAQNRRVEIVILPTHPRNGPVAGSGGMQRTEVGARHPAASRQGHRSRHRPAAGHVEINLQDFQRSAIFSLRIASSHRNDEAILLGLPILEGRENATAEAPRTPRQTPRETPRRQMRNRRGIYALILN